MWETTRWFGRPGKASPAAPWCAAGVVVGLSVVICVLEDIVIGVGGVFGVVRLVLCGLRFLGRYDSAQKVHFDFTREISFLPRPAGLRRWKSAKRRTPLQNNTCVARVANARLRRDEPVTCTGCGAPVGGKRVWIGRWLVTSRRSSDSQGNFFRFSCEGFLSEGILAYRGLPSSVLGILFVFD